ncbi:hypothetical protein BGZ61DRAFT_474102 [Ilyonectria robusta]|uniref:uncharacterized protein n=1 Tax=Ilyonectria robusta TaxID=1079257 RepID=UPI001E8ECB52|nr:uncharacterized protein BGZ61DRAFT_474102 [Ilyonectria robusta]KAH8733411.1 hypothetical protein BGZ61DRAFT_474102 [Ilyonectria robusta]
MSLAELSNIYGFCLCPEYDNTPAMQVDGEDEYAPIPSIPDPYDDDKDSVASIPLGDAPEPRPVPAPRPARVSRSAPAPRSSLPLRQKRPRCSLMRMPLEIRDEIYRNILVVNPSILVRAGWKRIYARKRPGIEIDIMCTNQAIYHETVRILYGENTFLYRLRDPPNPGQVVNVEDLSLDDSRDADIVSEPDDGASDSDDDAFDPSDCQEDADPEDSNQRELSDRIDITKFGGFFRRLIVEAERNRYSDKTQMAMAEAIKVFTVQPGFLAKACSGGVKTNIQTFTIRVAPQIRPDTFTFVDFFKKDSPVLEAIKSLPCQFVKIDLLTTYLNGGQDPKIARLTIDMRHLRFSQYAARQKSGGQRDCWRQDLWRNDRSILMQRSRNAKRSATALLQLENHVLSACNKYIVDEVIQRHMDELDEEMMDRELEDDVHEGDYEEVRLGFDDDEQGV